MGPVEVKAPSYTIVLGGDHPLMLDCKSLNVSMSLQRMLTPRGDEDVQRHPWGEVACGLRREVQSTRDAIDAMIQAYTAGVAIEPVKVLGQRDRSGRWSSTGVVVDGAIRVVAALEAGLAEVPVQLVAPHFADTPLEGMFLHYNVAHGARLTTAERDSILRIIARRYIRNHLGKRDAHAFARWLCERAPGLRATLVAEIVRNEFQVRTPDQWAEAERLGRGGAPTEEQLAKLRALNLTLPKDGRLSPGHIAALLGVSRAAVQKQFARLGVPSRTAEPSPDGHAPDATPELILESRIERVDARATAQDMLAVLRPVTAAFDRALHQIHTWVLDEAQEYRPEQAKVVWNALDRFWTGLLAVNRACHAYRDRYLAERDIERLRDALREAEAALAAHKGRGKASARKAG